MHFAKTEPKMTKERNYRERIVIDPDIHFGKPCIAGTRITAEVKFPLPN